jgi:hypothetical protein
VKEAKISINVIAGSDRNPRYRSCIPSYCEFWQAMNTIPHFSFWPKVVSVSERNTDSFGHIQFSSSSEVPDAFAAQISRLILPGMQTSDLVMTSDIDMVTLNPHYFIEASRLAIKHDSFVVMRNLDIPNEYPICYLIASPSNWRKVINSNFDFQLSVVEIATIILKKYEKFEQYSGVRGESGWNIDQKFIFDMVAQSNSVNIIELKDNETGFRRLDRIHHNGAKKWLSLFLILQRSFTDYHMHLPVEKNAIFIRCAYVAVRAGNFWNTLRTRW